ncbi:hypothetical protein C2857_004736 [Epichloe festucae Fl1]|uniref:Uncharacterized protein n=1 Tax=Epichloe festucae (strain Fl1) TaxID=877507 RepID=A0A7S9PU14_EPIFF|nr:hypothetical protein C2857_004736 [Epichloe festucae Fl1]
MARPIYIHGGIMLQMMKPTKFSKYPFLRTSMGIAPGNARKAKLYRPLDEFGLVDAESALSQRLARSIAVLQNEPFAKTAIAVNKSDFEATLVVC